MQVYVYIKVQIDENITDKSFVQGDIVFIYPMVLDQGKLTLDDVRPLVMDLKIPCGEDFKPVFKCKDCIHRDPESCDVMNYQRALWTSGDLFTPPKVDRKNLFYVDFSYITDLYGTDFPKNIKLIDVDGVYKVAKTNPVSKSIIQERI